MKNTPKYKTYGHSIVANLKKDKNSGTAIERSRQAKAIILDKKINKPRYTARKQLLKKDIVGKTKSVTAAQIENAARNNNKITAYKRQVLRRSPTKYITTPAKRIIKKMGKK